MAETLTYDPSVEAQNAPQDAPETGRFSHETSTGIIDASAGIILRHRELRFAEAAREGLDARYDGLLSRQSATDVLSMPLADDIFIDFRRDAQRAGFTDVDQMPAGQRAATAEAAAQRYSDDITAELEVHHPEWTPDEVATATAQRIRDIVTLLTMDTNELDVYRQAAFDYQEVSAQTATLEAEIAEFRAERKQRIARIGGFAVRGLVSLAGKLRDLPHAFNAKMTITGLSVAQRIRSWYTEKSAEGKKAVWVTAAGVAVTGIASYIAIRLNGHGSGPSAMPAFNLASNANDQLGNVAPDTIGNMSAPVDLGSPLDAAGNSLGGASLDIGNVAPDQMGNVAPVNVGNLAPQNIGGMSPNTLGSVDVAPVNIGTQNVAPDNIGSVAPNNIGNPDTIGGVAPENIGATGIDLSTADTTKEFFVADTPVEKWPDVITVSEWDPATKDGSLWGISEQMLQRSGVTNPTDAQIDQLVDTLRPQAAANGWLNEGQKLDLRPALDVLGQIS